LFSTYIDKAYHFEVFKVAGRRFLMLENNFEPEREPGFKTEYLIHAEVHKK